MGDGRAAHRDAHASVEQRRHGRRAGRSVAPAGAPRVQSAVGASAAAERRLFVVLRPAASRRSARLFHNNTN